ncbi:predicted protein [Histoplasma capsulatum var. duboisii H88]|uniref:Predicted protein n=1 Tax=Ajellomyces capsulatus (strain H88) TaxID=544711 RepID=F0UNK4_AJEC8|nr:predicted protein [Histoplasma capsulatum var. duboisii H88]
MASHLGLLGGTSSSLKSFVRISEEEEAEMPGPSPLRRCANTFILSGVGWVKHEEDIDNTAGLEEFAARKSLIPAPVSHHRGWFGETRNDKGLLRKAGSVRPTVLPPLLCRVEEAGADKEGGINPEGGCSTYVERDVVSMGFCFCQSQ